MNSFKTISFILYFIIFFLNIPINAQSIQKVTPFNAAQSAAEIKSIFGDLINASALDIENFYNHHWSSSQPYNAALNSPKMELDDIQDSSVRFDWAIQGAPPQDGYRISSLNLTEGNTQTVTTMNNVVTLNLEQSLFIVVIQSDFGSDASELDIIIIERIMFFTGCDCDCRNFVEIFSAQFNSGSDLPSHPWGPSSSSNQYLYEITYNFPIGLTASFKAKIGFNTNDVPIWVQMDENSMTNFYYSDDDSFLYVQDGAFGDFMGPVTFAQNPAFPDDTTPLLSYHPAYDFTGQRGSVKLSECKDRSTARADTNTDQSNDKKKTIKLIEVSSSFASNKTIEYQLPEDENISIYLLDDQGRFIKTLVNHTETESGTYQHHLNLSSYSNGTYIVILKTVDKIVPLKLLNIN